MGAIHMTTADIGLFATGIGAMATALTIMYKHWKEKVDKVEQRLEKQAKQCQEENTELRNRMFDMFETLVNLKEEIGYLKGLIKNTPYEKEVAKLANHNPHSRNQRPAERLGG